MSYEDEYYDYVHEDALVDPEDAYDPGFYDFVNNLSPAELAQIKIDSFDIWSEVENICSSCPGTVFHQAWSQFHRLLLSCVLYQCCMQIVFLLNCRSKLKQLLVCSLSILLSTLSMSYIFSSFLSTVLFVMVGLVLLTYFIMLLSLNHRGSVSGKQLAFLALSFIIFAEFYFQDSQSWNRMRGLILLLSMKVISYSFDIQHNGSNHLCIFEYLAYVFHPGTLMYGPWISLRDYRESTQRRTALSFNWAISIAKNFVFAAVCLFMSTCFASNLFVDPNNALLRPALIPIVANKWMSAFMVMFSFHFSHYYVCFLSVVTNQITGIGYVKTVISNGASIKVDKPVQSLVWTNYKVTNPWSIEIPKSMSAVTVAWNKPTSLWLKTYVFKSYRHLGVFPAIMCVYLASSLLHGLSLHIALVLLSLGVYTYVEESLRRKVSKRINCPYVRSRSHVPYIWRKVPVYAHLFNLVWILINLMHLIYLGSIFDYNSNQEYPSSLDHTLGKWSELNFFSHWFVLFCYIVQLFL